MPENHPLHPEKLHKWNGGINDKWADCSSKRRREKRGKYRPLVEEVSDRGALTEGNICEAPAPSKQLKHWNATNRSSGMEQCIAGHALPAGTGGAAPGRLASLATSLAARTRPSQRGQHSLLLLLDRHRDTTEEREKPGPGAADRGGGEGEEKRSRSSLGKSRGWFYYYYYYWCH